MSEYGRERKEPLLWRMFEAVAISFLLTIALIVALGEVLVEAVRRWWGGK
jgi:hypothetical protein